MNVASKIDRSGWPPGPWDSEPDRKLWITHVGFPAEIHRNAGHGHLCGYVGIPQGHPYYGRNFMGLDLHVHGGLTFASPSDECDLGNDHIGVHKGERLWWFGFDCCHGMDLAPLMAAMFGGMNFLSKDGDALAPNPFPRLARLGTYRTIEYVTGECEDLAEQLHAT